LDSWCSGELGGKIAKIYRNTARFNPTFYQTGMRPGGFPPTERTRCHFLFPRSKDRRRSGSACGCFGLLLYKLAPILTPFIAAAILAYALNPAVDYLAMRRPLPGKRMPRPSR
jgi:hypothetical protein